MQILERDITCVTYLTTRCLKSDCAQKFSVGSLSIIELAKGVRSIAPSLERAFTELSQAKVYKRFVALWIRCITLVGIGSVMIAIFL